MERWLMDLCSIYRGGNCPVEEVNNARKGGERTAEGKFPIWPSGKAQERLDELCEKCEKRRFEAKEPFCPACHGEIVADKNFLVTWGPVKPSSSIYYYRCLRCNSLLFSY